MIISENKKSAGKHCCAYGCTNSPVKKLSGLCYKHHARKIRLADPVYARYNQFKSKAKQRGIECSVTLPEFRQFCIDNDYIITPGRRGKNCTIDREDNRYGYHIWNMQILTNRRNIRKYWDEDIFNTSEEEVPF